MQIKTFRAANLQSALADIREQMGPNASVLHTRQVRDGWMGWLGRTRVEVTAGLKDLPAVIGNDVCDASLGNANSNVTATVPPVDARRWSTGAGQGGAAPSGMTSQSVASDEFEQTTEALKSDLIVAGVSDDTAHRWLTSATSFAANMTLRDGGGIEDRGRFWPHLQRAVAREIKLSGPIRTQPGERHIVSLVGPTGVGKTTTVAKLAAGFKLQSRRRVGLLTIDTYRIAAVQQLRAYAEIMDLPMQVVESPEQMQPALSKLGDVDLVLIDTAGRSPRSDARVEQLQGFLRAAQPDETHLVLSATSSAANIATTLSGFAPISATSLILTKLDETSSTAGVVSALVQGDRGRVTPLSYLTNGQQVPDDISVADAVTLVSRLLPAVPDVWGGECLTDEAMRDVEGYRLSDAA